MQYTIRPAIPNDIDEIINLCSEHAEYERAEYDAFGKKEKLHAFLFSNQPRFFCLIVENASGILGYAAYMFEFSMWDAELYMHMDCLYLRPHARGFGIGEAIIKEISKKCVKHQYQIMQWHTPTFNERAIKFYNRIGATSKQKTRFYLDEQIIQILAK